MNPIRKFRKARQMTQQALGAALGVSNATVSRIERGEITIDAALLRKLHEISEGEITPNDVVLYSATDEPEAA